MYVGKKVIFCVGYYDECYTLDLLANVWTQSGVMSWRKSLAGHSIHPELGLVVSGGYVPRTGRLATVEATRDGASFKQLADMPKGVQSHCQVRLIMVV